MEFILGAERIENVDLRADWHRSLRIDRCAQAADHQRVIQPGELIASEDINGQAAIVIPIAAEISIGADQIVLRQYADLAGFGQAGKPDQECIFNSQADIEERPADDAKVISGGEKRLGAIFDAPETHVAVGDTVGEQVAERNAAAVANVLSDRVVAVQDSRRIQAQHTGVNLSRTGIAGRDQRRRVAAASPPHQIFKPKAVDEAAIAVAAATVVVATALIVAAA